MKISTQAMQIERIIRITKYTAFAEFKHNGQLMCLAGIPINSNAPAGIDLEIHQLSVEVAGILMVAIQMAIAWIAEYVADYSTQTSDVTVSPTVGAAAAVIETSPVDGPVPDALIDH